MIAVEDPSRIPPDMTTAAMPSALPAAVPAAQMLAGTNPSPAGAPGGTANFASALEAVSRAVPAVTANDERLEKSSGKSQAEGKDHKREDAGGDPAGMAVIAATIPIVLPNQVSTNPVFTNQEFAKQEFANQELPNPVVASQIDTSQVMANQVVTNQGIANQGASNQVLASRGCAGQKIADQGDQANWTGVSGAAGRSSAWTLADTGGAILPADDQQAVSGDDSDAGSADETVPCSFANGVAAAGEQSVGGVSRAVLDAMAAASSAASGTKGAGTRASGSAVCESGSAVCESGSAVCESGSAGEAQPSGEGSEVRPAAGVTLAIEVEPKAAPRASNSGAKDIAAGTAVAAVASAAAEILDPAGNKPAGRVDKPGAARLQPTRGVSAKVASQTSGAATGAGAGASRVGLSADASSNGIAADAGKTVSAAAGIDSGSQTDLEVRRDGRAAGEEKASGRVESKVSSTPAATQLPADGVSSSALLNPASHSPVEVESRGTVGGARDQAPVVMPETAGRENSFLAQGTEGPVQVARLMERMGQAEMHIGLRTLAFGSVDVHTVIHESQVGVSIGSEHGDLRSLLAQDIPSLQAGLRQHELKLEGVQFLQEGSGLQAGVSPGMSHDSRSGYRHSQSAASSSCSGGGWLELSPDEIALEPARVGLNVQA
jgi:flagellar hook-length control protein FliK